VTEIRVLVLGCHRAAWGGHFSFRTGKA